MCTNNLTKEIKSLFEHTNITEMEGVLKTGNFIYIYTIQKKDISK